MSDGLAFLQKWFLDQCDGDWENDSGIEISTLDNPGWYLTVQLLGTDLEGRLLEYGIFRDDEPTWVHRWSTGETFEAATGPLGLEFAIEEFRIFSGVPGAVRHESADGDGFKR